MSDSYLDLHLEINSKDRFRTKLNGKRYNFNFPIVNFPYAAHAYAVDIFQLIQYSKACGSYYGFFVRGLLLTIKGS